MKKQLGASYEWLFRCLVLSTFIILFLNMTVDFPYISILRKIKYVYLVVLCVRLFQYHGIKTTKSLIVIVSLILIHTLLFGLIFVNSTVLSLTHIHCREMLLYIAMFFLTACDVYRNDWFIRFVKYLFVASAVFVLWNAVIHFSNFVNPLLYIYAFSTSGRIRSEFALGNYNYAGNAFLMCMFISLISFIIVWKSENRAKIVALQLLCILAFLGIELCMLFSTGSRTSLFGLLIFAFVFSVQYGVVKMRRILHLQKFQIAALASMLIVLAILLGYRLGVFTYLIEHSQRMENWTVNFPIFKSLNAWKLGIGYIESSAFLNQTYGYSTFACDSFYFYIFFTTGIVGSVLMAAVLIAILLAVLRSYRHYDVWSKFIVSLYIMMLFSGVSEVNIISYRFFSCTIYMIFIFYFILKNSKKKIIISF